MTYQLIIKKVSEEVDLPVLVVRSTYKEYWNFIKQTIEHIPLKDIKEEEFDNYRTNFNIPSLGKLYCTKERWIGKKLQFKCMQQNKNKKNAEDN